MIKIKFLTFLLIAYSLQLIPLRGQAAVYAEGIDMGPCKLYPIIKVEERFEDNIYELPHNQKSDFITTITPELLLEFKCSGKNIFTIDYAYEILHFKRYYKDDKQNNKFNTLLELYGAQYFLKISEDFQQITETNTYREYFDDYNKNDARFSAGRDFNDYSLEAAYENIDYDYRNEDSINSRNENIFGITGFYKIFPKTKLLAGYSFTDFNYENDKTRDGDKNEYLAGITGELSQKLTGTVKIGYQDRDYKNGKDWKEPVTYVDVLYEVSKKTSLDFTINRYADEATYTVENFYEINRFGIGLNQGLTAKTTASLDLSYEYDKYPSTAVVPVERKDDLWDAIISLDTKSRRWLNLGASFEFKKRNSNDSSYDYENNITSVYVKGMY